MRCDLAQEAISAAMDEPLPVAAEIERHVEGCPGCASFRSGAWRVRELVRFGVAPPVPDLVPAILAATRPPPAPRLRSTMPRDGRARRRWRAAVALSLAAGLVIGFVVTEGSLVRTDRSSVAALAAEIPSRLVRAAAQLRGYRASFAITELHWTKAVPRRTFVADVAFRAPEAFRVRVRDTTPYPSPGWPRNDLSLVTDGRTWRASGPDPCPREALPACPTAAPVSRSVVRRAPFDAASAMPTDVIVPMTVLAAAGRVNVLGPGEIGGRPAVEVELSAQDGAPLFQYARFLGSWRPFFPEDRVVVWLDRSTWFPLQYQVFPSPDPERTPWAAQSDLPRERPDRAIFTSTIRSLSTAVPPAGLFSTGPGPDAIDDGFVEAGASRRTGLALQGPTWTAGLPLYRAGSFTPASARGAGQTTVAYAEGLSWITVTGVRGWAQNGPFGVDRLAEPVSLGRGVALFEPASDTDPRRVALHTARGEFLVVSNLPRASLLRVAASLPFDGLPLPASWRVQRWNGGTVEEFLAPDAAVGRARFPVLLPARLPSGYRAATADLATTPRAAGLTIVYRRPAAELGGAGLILYQAPGQALPPVTGPDQVVGVGGRLGRWSPEEHRLEWRVGDLYVSLTGPAFDLSGLLRVAATIRPALPASPTGRWSP